MDSLQEALENAFLKYANNTAIEVENHTLTYAKLQNQSLNLLTFLRANSAGGQNSLFVFGYRELEVYVSILACAFGHITFIPLNPKFPKERLKNIIERVGDAPLLLCPSCVESFKKLGDSLPPLRIFSFDESLQKEFPKHTFITIPQQNNTQNSHQEHDLRKPTQDSTPAYLLFTSGSTGIPKGVLVTRKNLANYCQRIQSLYHFTPQDRISQFF
ncbi:AMP-binding protein, partial [Helicobacter sp.]|uniref:AMP-binding protein n=1 Tax=Helicobacter sp. TaxID=218 RepID=UPI002A9147D5